MVGGYLVLKRLRGGVGGGRRRRLVVGTQRLGSGMFQVGSGERVGFEGKGGKLPLTWLAAGSAGRGFRGFGNRPQQFEFRVALGTIILVDGHGHLSRVDYILAPAGNGFHPPSSIHRLKGE